MVLRGILVVVHNKKVLVECCKFQNTSLNFFVVIYSIQNISLALSGIVRDTHRQSTLKQINIFVQHKNYKKVLCGPSK